MTTPAEARLKVRDLLMEILVSLAVDDETTDDEIATFEDDMGGVADLMLSDGTLTFTDTIDGGTF